jgi:diacylglycerol kinase
MKIFNAFRFASNGVKYCFITQLNFRIHFFIIVFVILIGFLLQINSHEWMLLICCISMVLFLEMINTAIELLCNMYSLAYNISIKNIKDVLAGAVMIGSIASAIVGIIIFLPKIFNLINSKLCFV